MSQAEKADSLTAPRDPLHLLRAPRLRQRDRALQTLSVRLSLTDVSLRRLLALTGSYSDFVLSAADGSTAVRVSLEVSSVQNAEVQLGGGVVLDWATMTISRGFNRATLTRMELRLLAVLAESAPRTVSYAMLCRRLALNGWRKGGEGALAVLVCALRKRLVAIGQPGAIRNVRREGYGLSLAAPDHAFRNNRDGAL